MRFLRTHFPRALGGLFLVSFGVFLFVCFRGCAAISWEVGNSREFMVGDLRVLPHLTAVL